MEERRVKVIAASKRMVRKREAMFTPEEMAERMGCSAERVLELERSFYTKEQALYASIIGYKLASYPLRKRHYVEEDE